MSRRTIVAAAVAALLVAAGVYHLTTPAAEASRWDTDFGPVEILVAPDGGVSGRYPDYDGRIEGRLLPGTGIVEGRWFQPDSAEPCADTRQDTRAWGRLVWRFDGTDAVLGNWSYCDAEPAAGRNWDGRLLSGTHPMATAAGRLR